MPVIYGIYNNYEYDHNGEYDLIIGCESSNDNKTNYEEAIINKGKFLKFEYEGPMPQTAVQGWMEVINFMQNNTKYNIEYTNSFEKYTAIDKIEIYIPIKE